MSTQFLDIQPKELKFIFELKKHSSCSVRLANNTHHYVAFKVKTTSPKKYCVRPNVGVISPKSTCEFTVTMQAQRTAPLDMVCKDKFLIQSTIVPAGTIDEDITPSMFAKDGSKYIEENKLRVTLISPPSSPELSPINGLRKQGLAHEVSKLKKSQELGREETQLTVAKDIDESKLFNEKVLNLAEDMELKTVKDTELQPAKDAELKPAEDAVLKPVKHAELKPVEDSVLKPLKDAELKPAKNTELKHAKYTELEPANNAEMEPAKDSELNLSKDAELEPEKDAELEPANDAKLEPAEDVELKSAKNVDELNLVKDVEEMKTKLNGLESKLKEAEVTISKLTEEKSSSIQDIRVFQEKLSELSKRGVRRVQVGFPLLFVCMVAIVSVELGYLLHR
ncbi:vesicle-associated protein 2-2 [Castanea sativa]|uniref:vesicle-associated protein 2-2 n=1 Tax=Castanea sativa TaxID=21020 RepID=UPI003F649BE6